MRRTHIVALAVLAVLAVVAYLPVFTQPLVEDDYPNIEIARGFGPPHLWGEMFGHPIFRYRATFWVLTWAVDRLFGTSPLVFYLAGLTLHILCTWLVYALGSWRMVTWRVSFIAACFFAVYEGHQEAVMWYSGCAELLLFFFGVASFLCWVRFIERQGGLHWYALAALCFVLALLSKESAVVFAPLLALAIPGSRKGRKALWWWLPFAGAAACVFALIFSARSYSFRFQDGSFSLSAPFWITLPASFARLLWPWGILAAAALLLWKRAEFRGRALFAALWMGLALLPYSFLTYMHRVPSRQVYLASAGLALLFSAGFRALHSRIRRRPILAGVLAVAIAANTGYLWTKKRRQFLDRAAPTQALLALVQRTAGPVYMQCYPGPPIVYEAAVRLMERKPASILIWDSARAGEAAAVFCYSSRIRSEPRP